MNARSLRWFLLLCAGCAECAPGRVGEGAARLSVVSAATIVRLVEADDRCGFGSAIEPAIEGSPGEEGEVSWRVEGCRITKREERTEDCTGNATTVNGAVEVTATKTVRGLLTGDPDRPVIPSDESAAVIRVERARFDLFRVVKEGAPGDLEALSGEISFSASPRLASDTGGLCSVATPNLAVDDLRWTDGKARITTPDRTIDVDLPRAHLDAVVGELGDRSNSIEGAITVWEDTVELRGDLDERWEPAAWIDTYACDEELLLPLAFECVPPRARVAEGAARLTIRMLGALTTLISERCPIEEVTVDGPAGRPGVSRSRIAGCVLDFGVEEVASTDCFGISTHVLGRATVSAVRTVEGWATGDADDPIIPGARNAVTIQLEAELDGFSVVKEGSESSIEASGPISAVVRPSLAIDRGSGACSIATPNVAFSEVRWSGAQVVLHSGEASLSAPIDGSLLTAQNGIGDVSNRLQGEITAFRERFPIDAALDPDFDAALFVESYSCDPELVPPQSDEDCSIARTLALNAARILVLTTGATLRAVNENEVCGFANPELEPVIEGDPLDDATLTLSTSGCEVAPHDEVDCNRERTLLGASVAVDAKRTVRGVRVGIPVILPLDIVVPREADAVDVELTRAVLEGASLVTSDVEARFERGELSGSIHPILAEDGGLIGSYRVPTPVAHFERVVATDVSLTIARNGRKIAVSVDSAELEAFNGSFEGRSNFIAGEIVVAGERYAIETAELDPDFDQQRFDASYACTDGLGSPVPPQ